MYFDWTKCDNADYLFNHSRIFHLQRLLDFFLLKLRLFSNIFRKISNACTQAAIRFFHSEIRNFTAVPKRPFVFYSEIWNFTIVPKRPFVYLQQNTKCYSCIQTDICFLQRNMKLYSYIQTVIQFLQRNTKFYSCTQTVIRFLQRNTKFRIVPKWPFVFYITKHKISKFVPKRPFVFQNEIENFESRTQMANSYFPQGNTKSNYL